MKYYLKQKFLSWFDTYNVYDESDNIAYTIKGELSWGHKLKIYDKTGNEVGTLKEKLLVLMPKYVIYNNVGQEIGLIEKRFSLFKPKYFITPNDWTVTGDFFNFNYETFDKNNNLVMSTSKKIFHLTDNYEINVFDDSNSLMSIMIVLAIDIDKERQNESNSNDN